MIASSAFIASSPSLSNNAVKSILFRCAELLLAFTVFKLFSLLAARAKRFTSYLMFNEDYIQKGWFIFSQGLSRSGILVLGFAIAYPLAQLYGTFLWALDAPGFVMQNKNISASALQSSLLPEAAYIVSLRIRPDSLGMLDDSLPQTIGGNLFKPGVNFTLTGQVDRGTPQVAAPTQSEAGARIWLDNEGFSLSPDTGAMVTYKTDEAGKMIGLDCPVTTLSEPGWGWNCTFNNTFVQPLMTRPVGRPEVHWDDASDIQLDSRYVRPDRENNIWAAYGQGGGTAAMKQMFTVTKGTKRHTFIGTVARFTMVTLPGVPFLHNEVSDLVKRTWSTNPEEQKAPILDGLTSSILRAQDRGQSFIFGVNGATDVSCAQSQWEYLTAEVDGTPSYSLIRISITNITLIRSETVKAAPVPFETCDTSFQNEAEGGKVVDTDCAGMRPYTTNPRFFGQVDTSAVLILYGLGDGMSNISSKALDQSTYLWLSKNTDRIDDLLVSRGFIVSIDPSLVTLEASSLTPAISYLQLLLVLLTLFLALIGRLCLQQLASPHWSNSLLSNLLCTVDTTNDKKSRQPGYIHRCPDIQLRTSSSRVAVAVDNAIVKLEDHSPLVTVESAPSSPSRSVMGGHVSESKILQSTVVVPAEEEIFLFTDRCAESDDHRWSRTVSGIGSPPTDPFGGEA
ncbi:hypothetical protein H2198_008013 [Neophaeococcomyces mojaviensis]|uniref:Uncharacterized protein n=1 Tax=Neophaeococcomyces mojaviensis TaxID=3383035 RepID=A0ACC2ZYM2_9EURO|nr:hypothetical protein H2198_008013 [Knufia sp. JES_112]